MVATEVHEIQRVRIYDIKSHIQGVVAARAQEGRVKLLHVQGQEGWW